MTEAEILEIIHSGENMHIEFKKSTSDITKDVYDTVCSFSNRDGGIIILGVKDNGEILGIAPDIVDQIKKDFVTSINNGQKINPPLYLQPETYLIDGRTVLVIQVPVSSQVCRHRSRIFDRSHESDIDITDNSDLTEAMNLTLILRITLIWYISCTQEKAVAILSIKLPAFNLMIFDQI